MRELNRYQWGIIILGFLNIIYSYLMGKFDLETFFYLSSGFILTCIGFHLAISTLKSKLEIMSSAFFKATEPNGELLNVDIKNVKS